MIPQSSCPLCEAHAQVHPAGRLPAEFCHCSFCDLWHRSSEYRVSKSEENHRYQQHNNDLTDPNYRAFLQPVVNALKPQLPAGSSGLDYGCGPGPLLAKMLGDLGFNMSVYDPLFAPHEQSLSVQYDFVTATEVVEHFRDPRSEWTKLVRLVKPGGWLGVMTLLVQPSTDLTHWYYAKDPTHVVFYSQITLRWLAQHFALTLHLGNDQRTALFYKPLSRSEIA